MKVLEITYSWPAETFIVRHAHALCEASDHELVMSSKSPARDESASIQKVGPVPFAVINLPNFDHYSSIEKILSTLNTFRFRTPAGDWKPRQRAILGAIGRLNPDLVHFHFASLAVQMASFVDALQIPYTVSLRGSDIQVMPLTSDTYLPRLCKVLTGAAKIHAVSDDIANHALRLCPTMAQATTIRTCVPIPEELTSRPHRRGPLRFVAVGRLHWRKAFHDLIRAMVYLPDASLDIIGDGPEREHLLYLIAHHKLESRVVLHGSLPYDKFFNSLSSAVAFIQSSIAEGFSNALAEAMALGIPVFATAVGGTTELIRDGENGILIPEGKPLEMAEKLRLASDTSLMSKLATAARQTAEVEFSSHNHGTQFWQFYQDAIDDC